MIYTLYSFINYEKDCHKTWQSSTEYSEGFSEKFFSDKVRLIDAERKLAKTLLSYGLDKFFSVKEWDIEYDDHGKPHLIDYKYDGVIHINISHSMGVVAVCLSDKSKVGIDVQATVSKEVQKRLVNRFFKDVEVNSLPVNSRYYSLDSEGRVIETDPQNVKEISFTDKWAYCEALMKCNGEGFRVASSLSEISKDYACEVRKIKTGKHDFSLAICIKKPL